MLKLFTLALVGSALILTACSPPPASPPPSSAQTADGSVDSFAFKPDGSYLVTSHKVANSTVLLCGVGDKTNFASTKESGAPVCVTSALDASGEKGRPLPTFYLGGAYASARLSGQGGETFYVFDLDNLASGDPRAVFDQAYVLAAFLPPGGRWTIARSLEQFPYHFKEGGVYASVGNDPSVATFVEQIEARRPEVAKRLILSGPEAVDLLCATTAGVFLTVGPAVECELKSKT